MSIVWLVEYGRSEEESLADLVAGNFSARLIASPQSLLHLLQITELEHLPDLIVLNDASARTQMEIMAFFHALRNHSLHSRVLISSHSAKHWQEFGIQYFSTQILRAESFSEKVAEIKSHLLVDPRCKKIVQVPCKRSGASSIGIEIGDLTFDRDAAFVVTHGHRPEELSPKEVKILDTLVANLNRCVSRANLAETVWPGVVVSDRTLDSHVSRLRKKISASLECSIEAVYGEGYCLRTGT